MASEENTDKQTYLSTCSDHRLEDLDMYCLTCEKPICGSCLKETHLQHKWETMKKLARILRGNDKQRQLEIDSSSKSLINGLNKRLAYMENRTKDCFTQNMASLEAARQTWIKYINSLFDDKVTACTLHNDTDLNMIREHKDKLKSTEENLRFLMEKLGSDVEYSDFELIAMNAELLNVLNGLNKLVVIPESLQHVIHYTGVTLPSSACPPIFGTLKQIKVDPSTISAMATNEFVYGDTGITCMCPVSQNEVWIHNHNKTSIELVDKDGVVQKSIDFGCQFHNFAVSDNGLIYFCDTSDSKSINSIDDSGNIELLFTPSPFIPIFASLTHSNDLLVTLVEQVNKDKPDGRRTLVRRMTKSGRTLMDYEYEKDGRTPLFHKPTIAIEHYNGNVCVINETNDSQKGAKLYGFNSKGNALFKYNGMSKNFNPFDICGDLLCNTLVCDNINHCVHIVDRVGKLIKYLLTQNEVFRPHSIALLDNTIWISKFNTGAVKVFEYSYQNW